MDHLFIFVLGFAKWMIDGGIFAHEENKIRQKIYWSVIYYESDQILCVHEVFCFGILCEPFVTAGPSGPSLDCSEILALFYMLKCPWNTL